MEFFKSAQNIAKKFFENRKQPTGQQSDVQPTGQQSDVQPTGQQSDVQQLIKPASPPSHTATSGGKKKRKSRKQPKKSRKATKKVKRATKRARK